MAPRDREARFIVMLRLPPATAFSKVWPVLRPRRKQASLVSGGRAFGRVETGLAGQVSQFTESPRDSGGAVGESG